MGQATCVAYHSHDGHRCPNAAVTTVVTSRTSARTIDVLCAQHGTSSWLQFLCVIRMPTLQQAQEEWSINDDALTPAGQNFAGAFKADDPAAWLL
jgi:hypothetical protein